VDPNDYSKMQNQQNMQNMGNYGQEYYNNQLDMGNIAPECQIGEEEQLAYNQLHSQQLMGQNQQMSPMSQNQIQGQLQQIPQPQQISQQQIQP